MKSPLIKPLSTPVPETFLDLLVDAPAPFSEHFLKGMHTDLGHQHIGVFEHNELIGLAAVDGQSAELAIVPTHRGHGFGQALVDYLVDQGVTDFWAHGDHPAARAVAAAHGWDAKRDLLLMELENPERLPQPQSPWQVRTLAQFLAQGQQEIWQAWLEINNDAFSWHPEQGGWDLARLQEATRTEWFQPEGVLFLAKPNDNTPLGYDLAGFHWVKKHSASLGEIYVVGLSSQYRGQGLGQPLLAIGMNALVDAASRRIVLYVEHDNIPAVRAYEKLGFKVREHHVVYGPQ